MLSVAKTRLCAQRLSDGRLRTPSEVVRHLGAVQAQDYRQALWAIGIRTVDSRPDDIEAAIERRELLRAWSMRGTLHFLPGEDAGWMRDLFAPRILAKTTPSSWSYHRVDQALVDRAADVLSIALVDGQAIRRDELSALLVAEGVPDDRQQHYIVFAHLSHLGLLCHGPRNNGRDTLALFADWAPQQRALSRDEALEVLAERFFLGHGPATVEDFANWAGLAKADARAGVDAAADLLHRELRDRVEHWRDPQAREGAGSYLLPAYDELHIGYADRHHMFERFGDIPISTYNGMFHATVVVDGQVAGTWKNKRLKSRIDIQVRLAEALQDRGAVEAAASRFAAFHGLTARLTLGPPPDRERPAHRWGRTAR